MTIDDLRLIKKALIEFAILEVEPEATQAHLLLQKINAMLNQRMGIVVV